MKDAFHFGGVTARELLEDGNIDSSRLPPSEYRLMNSQARGVLVTAPDRDDFGLRHLQDCCPRQPDQGGRLDDEIERHIASSALALPYSASPSCTRLFRDGVLFVRLGCPGNVRL